MATTTNYGWTTPDDTSLVKDGAAAIRTLGSSVDTTTKALNPSTTLGDIEYRSATANTNTRLPIGTTGQVLAVVGGVPAWATTADQTPLTTKGDLFTFDTADARIGVGANGTVLTADSAEATGLKWAAPSVAGKSYSLLNTGGTALTGAATITISSISAKDDLMIMVLGASSASASSDIYIRLNADSGNNYRFGGPMIIGGAGYDPGSFTTELGNPTSLMRLFKISSNATATGSGTAHVVGCNTTGFKAFTVMGAGANDSGNSQRSYWYNGMYLGTSTISSVDIVSGTGNFDAGTVYIYGAA